MAVLSRRTREGEDRRAAVELRVLDATEALLDEGIAYAELSVERIALKAEISRTAFYDYFRDKRELLIRLMDRMNEPLLERAGQIATDLRSGPEALPGALRFFLEFSREHHAVYAAAFEASMYDDEIHEFSHRQIEGFVSIVQSVIEAHQAAGTALPLPARAVAHLLVLLTWHSCYERVTHEKPDLEEAELLEGLTRIWERTIWGEAPAQPSL